MMCYKIKYLLNLLLVISIVLGLAACDSNTVDTGDTVENQDTGQVRFIHSASSTAELDLSYLDLYDNNFYGFEYGITYGHQYGYYDFIVGDRTMASLLASTSIIVASADFKLEKDDKYTLIAHDFEATLDPDFLVLTDTTTVPDSAKSFVRFVHLGVDVPEVEIIETDAGSVITDLSHLEYSPYLAINSGTYTYRVQKKSTGDTLLTINPTTFLSQQVYTIILSGTVSELTPVNFNAKIYRETSL